MQVTKPTDHETVLERAFDAPPERVFAALTQPDRIAQWMQAAGMTLAGCEVDLRAGGRLRYVFKRPSGKTIQVRGEFQDVSPPLRLTYVETYDFSPLRILATWIEPRCSRPARAGCGFPDRLDARGVDSA